MDKIGFDRPLRPEWIYELLSCLEPNKKPADYYAYYDENICTQLTGKHGKRKTRTVLLRTFLYDFQDKKNIIQDNLLLENSRIHDLDYLRPIYIARLLMAYDMLRYLTLQIHHLFDDSQQITSKILTQRMVDKFGDLEIVKRTTRSFLKTLSDFELLVPLDKSHFQQVPKIQLTEAQTRDILKLYAISNHTKQVDILNLDPVYFAFYELPDLTSVAKKYHAKDWEYIRGVNRELLMMK